ncbi:MAG TPA: heme-binding domain-containing protein [Pyrinomonadaceae bacterium]
MRKFRKIVKWTFVVLVCLFLVAQFIGPARTNPITDQSLSIESQLHVDPQISSILDRSCNDCHSNKTRWPWYSNVAPVSWWVIGHVNDGRRDLNFSEWGNYDKRRQSRRLDQMCSLAKSGAMPLDSYTPMHAGSKLSGDDLRTLCVWTNTQANQLL